MASTLEVDWYDLVSLFGNNSKFWLIGFRDFVVEPIFWVKEGQQRHNLLACTVGLREIKD